MGQRKVNNRGVDQIWKRRGVEACCVPHQEENHQKQDEPASFGALFAVCTATAAAVGREGEGKSHHRVERRKREFGRSFSLGRVHRKESSIKQATCAGLKG